ncbi:HAMP domain-containing protein, partial [Pirellulales bacterium]|nr:HAMP domain-containing protein [Pirellulales bacterium]
MRNLSWTRLPRWPRMDDPHLLVDSAPTNRREWGVTQRRGLLLVAISPVVANLIGSAFNIWYNHQQIKPLLSRAELDRFGDCWMWFNIVIYPLAVTCWVAPLIWLRRVHWALLDGRDVDPRKLVNAQRTVVNLPWWILIVASFSWFICIPVFAAALAALPGPLNPSVLWHLSISFLTGSLIAVTHSFFAVEIVSQRCLFPVFFRRHSPADVPGAAPLSIRARGFVWAISAAVAPVVILVLLIVVPNAVDRDPWFPIAVGVVEIAFSITTGSMLGQLVAVPVRELRNAAIRVSEGDLHVRVNLMRADDFGPLISRFNQMVGGLLERERLQQTFGRHVGH